MKISDFKQNNKEDKKQEDLMGQYNDLKDLSQDDLTRKLFEETTRQKQEGTFDYEKLSSTLNSLSMYMPKENFEKMKSILERLKWEKKK